VNLVWLKKDLRLSDHAPLYFAIAEQKPFAVFFCFEPMLQNTATHHARHWWFMFHSLQEMKQVLAQYQIPLYIVYDEVVNVLQYLHQKYDLQIIFSHQETGTQSTYQRDKAVAQFCKAQQIEWREFAQNGIERGLKTQEGCDKRRAQNLRQALYEPIFGEAQIPIIDQNLLHARLETQLPQGVVMPDALFKPNLQHQTPGEKAAWQQLRRFVQIHSSYSQLYDPTKHEPYSHLSAHIVYGNISIRQIVQFVQKQPRNRHLLAFMARLSNYAKCVQLFEMECQMEGQNLNFAYNGIRLKPNELYLHAWKNGNTGIPIIDAAMRCLATTGYLNYELRVAVVSFLTHHLWLDWRKGGADYLAQMSLDFEAGIHYVQLQQQANATQGDKVRIYDPIKQARQHDPNAQFIKEWLPELQNLPPELCYAPWQMTTLEQQLYQFEVGVHYPKPIVDINKTLKFATNELNRIKNSATAQAEHKRIAAKHGG
jgi:deoxyribodipyrimidine photo-lyase